jgi:Methyltransferase domain
MRKEVAVNNNRNMNYLLLEFSEADGEVYHLTTESYIAIFLWKLLKASDEFKLKLVKTSDDDTSVPINFEGVEKEVIENDGSWKLPMLQLDGCHNVVGLCSVLRGMCRIMKTSPSGPLATQLLGFKENCLMSPSEVSLWTSLCEREMVECSKQLRRATGETEFPIEMMKLETDLANPVRVHNVYKVARSLNKGQAIKSGSVLNLEHKYCHSNEANLSDVILYSIYKLIFKTAIDINDVRLTIPLTIKWFENMEKENFSGDLIVKLPLIPVMFSGEVPKLNSDGKYFSLYKRELTGFRCRNRKIFTGQIPIDEALEKLKTLGLDISSAPGDPDQDAIDEDFVCELLQVGELPITRLEKKKAQLKSLANEVLKVAKPGDVIVDFCSGTGHLGFLVAKILPKCRVIILENKEESINRAKINAKKLGLCNVTFYQCNLVSSILESLIFQQKLIILSFHRIISTNISLLAYRCTLAVWQQTWFFESAGPAKPVSFALHAATAKFKISARSLKVKFIDKFCLLEIS